MQCRCSGTVLYYYTAAETVQVQGVHCHKVRLGCCCSCWYVVVVMVKRRVGTVKRMREPLLYTQY